MISLLPDCEPVAATAATLPALPLAAGGDAGLGIWSLLTSLVALFGVAMVLGALMERLRQSALVGYLLTGTLLGPSGFGLLATGAEVQVVAEMGVSLLLFSIGLEVSFGRLMRFGRGVLLGGAVQVAFTTVLGFAAARVLGFSVPASLTFGAAVALSSTACVLRVLMARAELDSLHGRGALGILLVQDLAVVPLVLVIEATSGGGGMLQGLREGGLIFAKLLALVVLFFLLMRYIVPLLARSEAVRRNRELPVLLAVTTGLGAAIAAHTANVSPAIGAFLAGMLLAESPFAVQVRADVGALRTLLMVLFFASVGMLADRGWIVDHLPLVLGAVLSVVIVKALVIWGVLRIFRTPHAVALTTGLCLAQTGEFGFVLVGIAGEALLGQTLVQTIVSVTVLTLLASPALVRLAPGLGRGIVDALAARGWLRDVAPPFESARAAEAGAIFIVGFGPAGVAAGKALDADGHDVHVIDLNPKNLAVAKAMGFVTHLGDATNGEVLEHVGVESAAAVLVTLPDPAAAQSIIRNVRALAANAPVLARARYHLHRPKLEDAGATAIADEEQLVGGMLAVRYASLLAIESPQTSARRTKKVEAFTVDS